MAVLWQLHPRQFRPLVSSIVSSAVILGMFAALSGCDSEKATKIEPAAPETAIPLTPPEERLSATGMISSEDLRKQLGANEQAQFQRTGPDITAVSLVNSGATTIKPLAGMPIKYLDISQTSISDISPVKTMPELSQLFMEKAQVKDLSPVAELHLAKLWANFCPVEDFSPLSGLMLEELNLCNTSIADLTVVGTMDLGTLWLRETPVTDLAPIKDLSLVSLDIQGSQIADLSPLAKMTSLKRLNIADCPITDLSPLKELSLTRLIFTPSRIEQGIDVARNMPSLREVDTTFEGQARAKSPAEFWKLYDEGAFAGQPSSDDDAPDAKK